MSENIIGAMRIAMILLNGLGVLIEESSTECYTWRYRQSYTPFAENRQPIIAHSDAALAERLCCAS